MPVPTNTPQQTEQWMEEARKEIESVLDLYSKGFGLQEDDCDVIDFPEATNRLLTLLTTQIEAAKREEREKVLALLEQHRDCKDQPCEYFVTTDHLYNNHECPECLGTRHFCDNCHKDHHDGGWRKCCIPSIIKSLTNHN